MVESEIRVITRVVLARALIVILLRDFASDGESDYSFYNSEWGKYQGFGAFFL